MNNVQKLQQKLQETGMKIATIRGDQVSIIDEYLAGELLDSVNSIERNDKNENLD